MPVNNQSHQLFAYDLWANEKIGSILIGQESLVPSRSVHLFAHIRAAQQIWYRRIKGRSFANIDLWPQNTSAIDEMRHLEAMNENWLVLLDENAGYLKNKISYQNSTGNEFQTPLHGILDHVIIHSQHHRAQMALLFRENKIDPPSTDYIFYLRDIAT